MIYKQKWLALTPHSFFLWYQYTLITYTSEGTVSMVSVLSNGVNAFLLPILPNGFHSETKNGGKTIELSP